MMEKEVEQLVEVAWKAARCGNLEHKCINALSKIRSLPLSVEAIVNTHAAKRIGSLCTHPRSNIKDLASLILTNWRRKLYNHGRKSVQDPKSAKPSKRGTPKTVQARKKTCLKAKHDQCPPVRGDSMSNCDNPIRNKIRQQIFEALCMVLNEAIEESRGQVNSCDPVGIAASVESAVFVQWGLPSNGSRNKYRSFLFNLKDPRNSDFRRKILFGSIKPEDVTKLNAQEMASEGRQNENENIKARALHKCIVGTEIY